MRDRRALDATEFLIRAMHVLVIGAGAFGAWSAKCLADAGHVVTLVDAYGPANPLASSGDHSRVIRAGYGRDEIYSRWASDAWADWQWLSDVSGEKLLLQTGALFLGEPGEEYVSDTYATLTTLGLPVERLEPAALRERFAALAVDGLGSAVYEPRAGVIRAQAAVRALVELMVRGRSIAYSAGRVEGVDEQRARVSVTLSTGEALQADAYVFACGPWLPGVFPDAIGARIRPTRQEVLYFSVAGELASRLPVWIDFAAGVYCLPDVDGRGVKVGIDRHGPLGDPETVARVVAPAQVQSARELAGRRLPALRDAALVEARVCLYENTSSGDFIIDRHPRWPDCWIVGGGSGHGFKHGPSVGRHVAALVSGKAEVIRRFALAKKTTGAARSVY